MDFKKATELFADPAFDGEPVQIYEPGPDESPVPPEEPDNADEDEKSEPEPPSPDPPGEGEPPGEPRRKYVVDDVEVFVAAERVQYYGKDGRLITESLKDFTKKTVCKEFASLDDFLRKWNSAEKKQAVIAELEEQGVLLEALADEVGKDFGPFDLICHVAFDQPPLTRRERAEKVRKQNYFTRYGDQAREVLNALLDKYADEGIENIEDVKILRIQPFDKFGTPIEIVKSFGGRREFDQAIRDLERHLYDSVS
jgi:type I restriction enzyme R subunit